MQAVAQRSMLALTVISLIALAPLVAAQRQPQNQADSDSCARWSRTFPCSTWSGSNSIPT